MSNGLKRKIKNIFFKISNYSEFQECEKILSSELILSNREHIMLASEWLLLSQQMSESGGYSRAYNVLKKSWDAAYVETTGYIIPTLYEVYKATGELKFKESVIAAGKWLLEVQKKDGAFCDIDVGKALAFDTGQCLIGLNYLYTETKDKNFLEAAIRAADWLCFSQDNDGTWTRVGYLSRPHTYYTRVAAALLKIWKITKKQQYYDSAARFLNWAINQQQENGFFKYCEFQEGVDPVLHTIIYVIEGLIESYHLTSEDAYLNAALKSAEVLKIKNQKRDLILFSQYNLNWDVTNTEKCITGLAQWAGVCLDLFEITNDKSYFELAVRNLYYLKSKQFTTGQNLRGGFPGSIPISGYYSQFSCVNWGNKFFIDAMLKYDKISLPLEEEQELWTAACFSFLSTSMSDDLYYTDNMNLDVLKKHISTKNEQLKILDLGCGRGKYIKKLKQQYPGHKFIGVDPYFYLESADVVAGSAYNLKKIESSSIDILFTVEVLQHVKHLDKALIEIRRVLKPNGKVFIFDRNIHSGLGYLKRYYERSGRWMYPSDSPFRERWYSQGEWERLLLANHFNDIKIQGYSLPGIVKGFHRFFAIEAEKT